MSSATHAPMDTHPDIAALRAKYDAVAEQPTAQVTEGLLLIAGLYAAASAWIVGFDAQLGLTYSNLICGIAIAVLALAMGAAYSRTHGLAFVTPLLGVWLIVSPWIIANVTASASVIWSNVVIGAIVLVLGLGATAMGMSRRRP